MGAWARGPGKHRPCQPPGSVAPWARGFYMVYILMLYPDSLARFVGPTRQPDSWARFVGPIRVGPIRGPIRGPDSWLLYGLYMDAIWLVYGTDMDSIWHFFGFYKEYMNSSWMCVQYTSEYIPAPLIEMKQKNSWHCLILHNRDISFLFYFDK